MTVENKKLLDLISKRLEQYPNKSFGTTLYELGIASHRLIVEYSTEDKSYGVSTFLDLDLESSSETLERITSPNGQKATLYRIFNQSKKKYEDATGTSTDTDK